MATEGRRLWAFAIAAVCLLLAVSLWAASRDERRVERANAAGLRGDFEAAAREARAVTGGAALPRAATTEGYALAALGQWDRAAAAFARASRADPSNWVIRRDRARVLLVAGHRDEAQREMGRALALNPRMALPTGFAAP